MYIPVGYKILIMQQKSLTFVVNRRIKYSLHIVWDNCKPEDTLVTKDAHLKVVFKASTL